MFNKTHYSYYEIINGKMPKVQDFGCACKCTGMYIQILMSHYNPFLSKNESISSLSLFLSSF